MATITDCAIQLVQVFPAIVPVGQWESVGEDGETVSMWKKPLFKGWTENPLRTEKEVRKWFAENKNKYPSIPGVAIVTGQISGGYIVIDLDVDEEKEIDGKDELISWQRKTGIKLPDTWTVVTGRGGTHFYYHTTQIMNGYVNRDVGIDLRADGNCAVAPPSKHPNGNRYYWDISPYAMPCAEANRDVMRFIEEYRPSSKRPMANAYQSTGGDRRMLLPPEIHEGSRTSTLISLIGVMTNIGASDQTIEAAVRSENAIKVRPPLTEIELQKEVFPAIYRWEKGIDKDTWNSKKNCPQQSIKKSKVAQNAELMIKRLKS